MPENASRCDYRKVGGSAELVHRACLSLQRFTRFITPPTYDQHCTLFSCRNTTKPNADDCQYG